MWVDFHWHARDKKQRHKETIGRSLAVAEAAGLDAIGAMPNTDPPLLTWQDCEDYLALADACCSPVQFYVHVGLINDVEQQKRAVEAVRANPRIIGIKAVWGETTGGRGIHRPEQQYAALETLAKEGFAGVLVGHFEDVEKMKDDAYDPQNPRTWSTVCRPEEAEISSFQRIIKMAVDVKFPGKIHVAHASTPYVIDEICAINSADSQHPLKGRVSCDVTWHHIVFDYRKLDGKDGAWYKCNPPLRAKSIPVKQVPIVVSDHAPHTAEDKQKSIPASGIASGTAWPRGVNFLRRSGMLESVIRDVCFNNAVKLYGLDLEPRYRRVDWEALERLQRTYPFDAFKELKS